MRKPLAMQLPACEAVTLFTGFDMEPESLIKLDRATIAKIVHDTEQQISDGDLDSVRMLVLAKKGQELFNSLEKKVRPYAEEQARVPKHDKLRLYDTEIIEKETGVSYDYSMCNDAIWNELHDAKAEIEQKLKEREAFLKTVTKPTISVDTYTGEVWEVKPPLRTSKQGLNVSLK
ncbi:hypothetical protein HH214_13545 [Mucilaginibacter robiniae]|uniref:Uncharacterized protein n=1 Tax=Mucilaginibacter robiniae TaxID=2728022 RepID=A0A7L5E381_9SPHI|nr:hypothetical protein [Mucilaginibacter robiniae]QJD96819.1 hypothetical protein HH214_13545 [Mucilaginibacter robiniae]